MWIPCPYCGVRDEGEFLFGGEDRGRPLADPEAEFTRAVMRTNAAGPQRELWQHAAGCGTWFTVTRDTTTNEIDADAAL